MRINSSFSKIYYQVFVSSTFEDLQEERKAVSSALLEEDCIPAGMELFPASNQSSWSIIKKSIDESDFYLLLIGGRYGSVPKKSKEKISYTEMEYNYAVKTKKPIIAFIHNRVDMLYSSRVEPTKIGKIRLEKFAKKVQSDGRNVKYWHDQATLVSAVKTSVRKAKEEESVSGWIKRSEIEELLQKSDLVHSGIENVFNTVDKIDYTPFIRGTTSEIDIVHIHGMTWTNKLRAPLTNVMKRQEIKIRIILLDVGGLFFVPYARYINYNPDRLYDKTKEVLEIWKTMYENATSHGEKQGADVTVYFHNGYPSKSLYRFDNKVIATPVVMTGQKSPLMPTLTCCGKGSEDQDSIFSSYLWEINTLVDSNVYAFKLSDFCAGKCNPIVVLKERYSSIIKEA